jgi:hypothetical protein
MWKVDSKSKNKYSEMNFVNEYSNMALCWTYIQAVLNFTKKDDSEWTFVITKL